MYLKFCRTSYALLTENVLYKRFKCSEQVGAYFVSIRHFCSLELLWKALFLELRINRVSFEWTR